MASEEENLRRRGTENTNKPNQNDHNVSESTQKKETMSNGNIRNELFGNLGQGVNGNAVNSSDNSSGNAHPARSSRTAHEHALAVQQWMWQCQVWHSMNWAYMMTFPMYMANMMSFQQFQQQQGGAAVSPGVGVAPLPGHTPPVVGQPRPGVQQQAADVNNAELGVRFRIPSLWKRVAAEFIDFFVLFIIKLAVTILTVEYVGIVDIQKYDLDLLLKQNIDYNTAFAMTSELIAMEIINRIFICIFETLCLRRGVAGMIGGTTPGKSVLGLRVVSCEQIFDGPGPRMIRVIPAGDIGIWNALVRSVIKNFSLAFFFPVCFTVFFFQHNRAAYDIISNCIVVEMT